MQDATAVVHLAARPSVPRSIADPVAIAPRQRHRHRRGARGGPRAPGNLHVIVASSSSVYGANPTLPKREDLATCPLSPYAASKLATESYALAYQHSFGLPVLAFRFFNVFGPLQAAGHAYAAVVPAFVAAALEGRPLVVHGDGQQTRDFTYVDTVTEADRRRRRPSASRRRSPVNLAFGTRTDLLALIAELEDVARHDRSTVEHVETRVGDVRTRRPTPPACRSCSPTSRPPRCRDALRATVDWFRARS